ncbi:MAG: acyltransferase [Acidimicrobiales bacterium]|nr:acyltransferase [Acidimicrobiales bacterium]
MRSPAAASSRADTPRGRDLDPGGRAWQGAQPGRLHYVPGLDGLRAIAVMAVLLYHANLTGLFGDEGIAFPGGFLGVEVFFVVSGYLITALLLSEWRDASRIALGNFWLRRARRLLPALFLLLAAVMVVSLLFYPDEVASLRGDVLSALGYVTNWNFILADKSYFEQIGRPSMVTHLWSLAVEEQFYLIWPLVFAFGMKRLGARRFGMVVIAGAALSALWMFILFDPDADPSRVFMGTDTRASALLIGCALAFVWPQWRLRAEVRAGARVLLDVAGVAALAGLVWMFWSVGEFDTWLYPFGFLACSLLSAVAIATVVHPASRLGPALGNGPMRWVGVRSYGIYLWHWPIFMITRPGIDVQFEGLPLFAFRFGLTFAIAALSYRYVEEPIRRGAIGKAIAQYRSSSGQARQQAQFRLLGGSAMLLAFVGVISVSAVNAEQKDFSYLLNATPGDTQPADVGADEFAAYLGTPGTTPSTDSTVAPESTTTAPAPGTTVPGVTTVPAPPPPTPPTVPLTQRKVVFLGDSVMLGAKNTQAISTLFGNAPVDAQQNRQVAQGIEVLRTWSNAGWLQGVDAVVVHLGTNGTFTDAQFDQIMTILAGAPKVVFVNDKVPQRSWEGTNNQVIAAGVARYPGRAVLVDWYSASANRPELFYDDGTHLKPDGAAFYAQLIASAL